MMENFEKFINSLETEEKNTTRNSYLKFLKKWPWFVISCLISLAIALVFYKITPERYQVESRLWIFGKDKSLTSDISLEGNHPYNNDKINISDQVGILHSYSTFKNTIDNLNWQTSWYVENYFSKVELYKNEPFHLIIDKNSKNTENILLEIEILNEQEYSILANGITFINGNKVPVVFEQNCFFNKPFKNEFFNFTLTRLNAEKGKKYYLNFNNPGNLTLSYLKKIKYEINDENSELVRLYTKGSNPLKDADFLNELNSVFIQSGMEKKNINSEESVNFLDDQTSEIEESLKKAEDNYNKFRESTQAVDLRQETNLIYEKLHEIEDQQFQLKQQIDYYRNLKNSIGDSQKISQISNPSLYGVSDDGLNEILSNLRELYKKREVLSLTVQKKSPNYIRLESEITYASKSLEENLSNLIESTQRELQNLDNRYQSIRSRLSQLPRTEKNLTTIQREFDLNSELYNYMQKKKAEASISQASIAPQAKVIDPALVESALKVGPNIFFYLFGGLALGFIIPFLIISISLFFNTKIETLNEIENESSLIVIDGIVNHNYKTDLPVVDYPRSGIAESFRSVKITLLNKLNQTSQKVISINSLIPGEGKSFVASNLASIFAMSNKMTLFIGADLRKPKKFSFQLNDSNSAGLSSYLNSEANFDEIISKTSVPNLFFVPSGPIPPNPSELLEDVKFEKFINHAREMFDYIILDNAPIMLVPDGIWNSQFSDINIFLLRLNYSRKDQVKQINKIVKMNNIKESMILANDTPYKEYGYGKKYWEKGYGNYHINKNV